MEEQLKSPRPPQAAPRKTVKRVSVRNLLQNDHMLILEHQGEDYVLRVTRNGKLILTK
jgi:hemin uptake protein HemP